MYTIKVYRIRERGEQRLMKAPELIEGELTSGTLKGAEEILDAALKLAIDPDEFSGFILNKNGSVVNGWNMIPSLPY